MILLEYYRTGMKHSWIYFSLVAVLTAGCAPSDELYVEWKLRHVWLGMTPDRVAVFLGPPYESRETYELKDFEVTLRDDAVDFIFFKRGDHEMKAVRSRDGKETFYRDDKELPGDTTNLSWPIRLGMSRKEVEAIMGSPVVCRRYSGDVRAEFMVCFKDGRAVSKELLNTAIP